MKILIAGGGGYIGSALIPKLLIAAHASIWLQRERGDPRPVGYHGRLSMWTVACATSDW
jgi:nucleoside-diphosphate-sugar epimerase